MHENFKNSPVFPIPPSYYKNGKLNLKESENYIDFLKKEGVKIFMTTAGTSQFNLLSNKEIRIFNKSCMSKINKSNNTIVVGLPQLSYINIINEIRYINKFSGNIAIIILYPDRYYDDDTIVKYFYNIANLSKFPVFIHGMPMRQGNGGNYEYKSKLINTLSLHDNIIGMKEESSSIDYAFDLCNEISKDFIKIVAGKSQRRFVSLYPAGAQTFLAGIGNIFPKIELDFYNEFTNGNMKQAYEIMENETKLFKVFMKIGWHKCLREALKQKGLCCNYNRQPFCEINNTEKYFIEQVLTSLS